jgi:hypothetical protein
VLWSVGAAAQDDQNPFTNSSTESAPASRSFEICWYAGDCDHSLKAASSGKDIKTTLSRSQLPSTTVG